MTSKVTNSFSKEELESHGITLVYLVNPSTFCPCVKIFNNKDIMWSSMKEFNLTDTFDEVDKFIDETAYKIIYKNRIKKINKIINR